MILNIFYVHPDPWGNDPISRAYFANGLVQPPTRINLVVEIIDFTVISHPEI